MGKKVIVINPRGIKGDEEYLHGMVNALNELDGIDVELFTNYYYEIDEKDVSYECHRVFFRCSEKMNSTFIRKIVRVLEYIFQYCIIIRYVKKRKPDIVHIHWSIISRIDYYLWALIKRKCGKLIYTAHNVLPHIHGEKFYNSYSKLYDCADRIIVHGNAIFAEFKELFPQYLDKVYISRHGRKQEVSNFINYDEDDIKKYEAYFNRYNKLILCFGMIYYQKGIDRLAEYWKKEENHHGDCLIIAGKINSEYPELNNLMEYIRETDDVIFIEKYISNNFLSYLLEKSDIIVLPYRHASMSGVMMTAAAARTPVLCTDVGSFSEYITPECGWVVENTDEALFSCLSEIMRNCTKEELKERGKRFNEYINAEFSWKSIVDGMVLNCY